MDKLKNFWKQRRGLAVLIVALVGAVLAVMILQPVWMTYLLIAGGVIIAVYLSFDLLVSLRRRKRQADLDERIAAKEGIADRKREWLDWTQELDKGGIDRYELPFYLLVGEPQSGKSIMLKNSGLHFPLGQSKLSGPGGTRGCDWWFTEEAVVLDLAGRLFTHDGGSSDASEWEAFLELLADYRPLAPANGVLLVIPCDSLLQDPADVRNSKAVQIRESLSTLVNKLEAKLPIYLVLTKADRVFGFAESVHRLEGELRRQMFGWSRPGDEFEESFDLGEFRSAFKDLKTRAHLLRAGALSGAKVPDALPEVDRLFAFPEELGTLEAPLEDYLRLIFTGGEVAERLFLRGLYLTSGLQQGKPIAQACAALMGSTSEADARDLEGLFTKQRAYFIRDFIQERVFQERGLVRPTSERVTRSRKLAMMGYGSAALLATLGALWMGYSTISSASPSEILDYKNALGSSEAYLSSAPESRTLADLLLALESVEGAIETDQLSSVDLAGKNNIADFEALHSELCRADLARLVRAAAETALETEARIAYQACSFAQLEELAFKLDFLLGSMPIGERPMGDFSLGSPEDEPVLLDFLGGEAQLAPFLRERTGKGSSGLRASVFASAIQRQLAYAGGQSAFGPSGAGQASPALMRAGASIAALYDRFLSSPAFGGGLQVEPEETSNLERVALLYRLGQGILATAQELRDPNAALKQRGGAASSECALISSGYARLQKSAEDLRSFNNGFNLVSASAAQRQLDAAARLMDRVLVGTGHGRPAKWREFEEYTRALFDKRAQAELFREWRPSSQGARQLGTEPKPSSLPLIARRTLDVSPSGSTAEGGSAQANPVQDADVFGELILPELDGLFATLGLDQALLASKVADCSKEVVQPDSAADPFKLMEFMHAKLTVNASLAKAQDRQSAERLLRSQVSGIQAKYAELYRSAKSSDETLRSLLASAGQSDGSESYFGFDLQVMGHLAELRSTLHELDPTGAEFANWLSSLDTCVESRLTALGAALTGATPQECVRMPAEAFVDSLIGLAREASFSSQAELALASFLAQRRAGLLEAWSQLSLGEVLAQLSTHLKLEQKVISAEPQSPAVLQARDAWLRGAVNALLAEGIPALAQAVRTHWESKARVAARGDQETNLKNLARELKSRLDAAQMRAEFERHATGEHDFGVVLRNFARVQALLGERGGESSAFFPGAARLSGPVSQRPRSLDESLKAVLELLDTVEADELRGSTRRFSGEAVPAQVLSDSYRSTSAVLALLGGAQTDRGGDAARYFLGVSLGEFKDALFGALSARYRADFEHILSAHAALLASPIFQKNSTSALAQFDVQDMHALLHAVSELHRNFGLDASSASASVAARMMPFEGGTPAAIWDNFLYDLAVFFDASGARDLGNLRFSFVIAPGTGKFWSEYGRLKQENLGYWWPFGQQEFVDVGPSTKSKSVDWEFGRDTSLYMAWNDGVSRPAAGSGNSLELEGSFAPLVLAWHYGVRDASDERKRLLSIPVSGGEIPLSMKLPAGFPDLPGLALPSHGAK